MEDRGRSSYRMNSNKVRNRKSNESQHASKGTSSSRPTYADDLETTERRSGTVVSRGRVWQCPRKLLHRRGADSRGVARKARRTMGTARRGPRGALSAA